MKKRIKKIVSVIISLSVVLGYGIIPSTAADNEINVITTKGNSDERREMDEYTSTSRWSENSYSYMFSDNDDSFGVVDIERDYSNNDCSINVDIYDMNYQLKETKSIPMELELFGGFYSGQTYNYMVFGQENMEEDDNKEVVRIVKYDKEFNRLESCAVKDCYTTIPFDAGNLRMAENGNELVVHTTRQRYLTEDDGLRHQSQLTVILNVDDMSIKNELGEFQDNHVSHSFNQFVTYFDGNYYLLDHGDAYPRSVVINSMDEISLFDIPGPIGANCTGVTVGGFSSSENNFLAAINTIDHSKATGYDSFEIYGLDKDERDIVLLISDHNNKDTENVKKVYLTDYAGKGKLGSTPYLIKLSDKYYMVMWQEYIYKSKYDVQDNGLRFVIVDEFGNSRYTTKEDDNAVLSSDCQPIKINDSIVWYLNNGNGKRTFYVRDLNKDKIKQNINVSTITDKTYGDSTFKINVSPDSNSGLTKFDYISDDEDVATIDAQGNITIRGAGETNIIVKQAGNDEYASFIKTQKLTISKAAISVKADDRGKKIGNPDPEFTYTITSGQLYGSDKLTGALSRKSGENIGTYNITQGTLSAGDNYTMSFTPGTFSILEKTPQDIKVSEITDKTYGDSPFKISVTPDSTSGLTDFTYESDNPNVAEISADGTVTIKGAGETNITVRQAGDDEYAAFAKTQKLVVSPKSVTISSVDLDNKTAVITGLLGNDRSVSLDFNKLQLNDIAAVDESTSSTNVSNFVLSGDGSVNYKVETETLPATIKTENIITINIVSINGTVTGAGNYIKGSTIVLTATPNSGYKFSGWVNGTGTVSSEINYTLTADESIEFTAKFTRKSSGGGGGSSTYLIKFNTDGGNEISNQRVSRNSKVKEPANPIKEDYEFDGWYSDAKLTKKYDFGTKVTANATLYAKWIEVNSEDSQIVLTIGKKEAKVFGKIKSNDVAPKIVNDRTMLPARFVAENIGANVEWFGEEQKVRVTKDDIEILIFIGSDRARVNNKEVILDSPAFIENDRTYTPIRFISEELGATVEWDENTQEVTITK